MREEGCFRPQRKGFPTGGWIAARVGYENRSETAKDILAPFVVIVKENGKLVKDRSDHYLIREFNIYYDGKLTNSPVLDEWVKLINRLSKLGAAAFDG